MSDTQPKGAIAIGSLPGMRELINGMTQPKEHLRDHEEMQNYSAMLRTNGYVEHADRYDALLEENNHWKKCFLDANADWARTGNELADVRTELEQVKAERDFWEQKDLKNTRLLFSLNHQLVEKDKVLEWYAVSENFEDTDDLGERARTILQQFRTGEDTDAPK
jgi:hypothetical protein